MDEVIIDDIISYMLSLSGYPDFSLAIKLYKNTEIEHLDAILFVCKCKKTLSECLAQPKGFIKSILTFGQIICSSVLKMIPVKSSPASNNEDILPREVLPHG